MIIQITEKLGISLRVLKNMLLRPFRAKTDELAASLNKADTSAFSELLKGLPDMLKRRPEKPEDYYDWGSIYVAKSTVIMIVLLLITLPLIYIFLLHPLLTSWFWVKDFYAEDEAVAAYNGRVRIYFDEELERLSFEGRLEEGKAAGDGTAYYESGAAYYEGKYSEGEFDGSGILYYENGSVKYRGTFSAGELSEGEYTSEDGTVYSGSFEGGLLQGSGTMSASGRQLYIGEFKDGVPDGNGKQLYPSGAARYVGSFSEGVPHGAAMEYSESGTLIYSGSFMLGAYSGEGTLYDESGKKLYSGGFEAGNYSGGGTLYGTDGSITYGSFEDGDITGTAERVYSNGTRYEGVFSENIPNGAGVLTDSAGSVIYSGIFAQGDYDYSRIVGQPLAAVREMFPSLTQTAGSDCFYLEDRDFGVAVRFSFASAETAAMAEEIFARPFSGSPPIKSAEDITALFKLSALSIAETENPLPEWAGSKLGIDPKSVKCYTAEYDTVTVFYWTDRRSGELLLRSAESRTAGDSSGAAGDAGGSALSYEEIAGLFDELGLNIEDFESLGF